MATAPGRLCGCAQAPRDGVGTVHLEGSPGGCGPPRVPGHRYRLGGPHPALGGQHPLPQQDRPLCPSELPPLPRHQRALTLGDNLSRGHSPSSGSKPRASQPPEPRLHSMLPSSPSPELVPHRLPPGPRMSSHRDETGQGAVSLSAWLRGAAESLGAMQVGKRLLPR